MKHMIFPHNEKIDFSKKLKVKFGIDPTADRLHLGHLIPLLVVKDFLSKGHHVDIVLGTFTAQLGDPTGKNTMRPILDAKTTLANASKIMAQVIRVLGEENQKDLEFQMNHLWFEKMNAIEMTNVLSKFTVSNLLARDSFSQRVKENNPIGMHELVVPILQGIDSVELNTDVEIGGRDQLFNFNITREVQRAHEQAPEVCMLMPIINGTDGRKMSKSFNNCIFLDDKPEDVFGKAMSISDDLMKEWWPVISESEFPIFNPNSADRSEDFHPMKLKKDLAWLITNKIWGEGEARKAFEHFESIIQNKNLPDKMLEIKLPESGIIDIFEVVMKLRKCSKSEALRLLKGGAVTVDDGITKITEPFPLCNTGVVIKVGKRDFAKLV